VDGKRNEFLSYKEKNPTESGRVLFFAPNTPKKEKIPTKIANSRKK
jgi:hypothetical protein